VAIHFASEVAFHAFDPPGEIAESLALAFENAKDPAGSPGDVEHVSKRDLGRHGHAVFNVAIPLPLGCQVQRGHEGAAVRRYRPLDEFPDEAAVTHDVELEPKRSVDRRSHVLDRADRHGAQAERNAGRLHSAAHEDLSVAPHHAAQPDRGNGERELRRFADDRRG
jgi:hypothetical protein